MKRRTFDILTVESSAVDSYHLNRDRDRPGHWCWAYRPRVRYPHHCRCLRCNCWSSGERLVLKGEWEDFVLFFLFLFFSERLSRNSLWISEFQNEKSWRKFCKFNFRNNLDLPANQRKLIQIRQNIKFQLQCLFQLLVIPSVFD